MKTLFCRTSLFTLDWTFTMTLKFSRISKGNTQPISSLKLQNRLFATTTLRSTCSTSCGQ
ncbi:unnamed protein product, partial [Larinioides sclopetarius]